MLMSKLSIKNVLLHLFVSGLLVWILEALIHVFIGPGTSFLKSILDTSAHELATRLSFWLTLTSLLVIFSRNKIIQDQRVRIENIFNNVIPICITNLNYEIISANNSYWSSWGRIKSKSIKCHEHRPGDFCHTNECALTQVINGAKKYTCESYKQKNCQNKHFLVTATPYFDTKKRLIGVIESFQDITERRRLEDENEHLITSLQESLDKVKLLSGFLPICASCKSIKDDKGFWSQVEAYIANHSEAKFSHGICPTCAKKLYPEIYLSNTED